MRWERRRPVWPLMGGWLACLAWPSPRRTVGSIPFSTSTSSSNAGNRSACRERSPSPCERRSISTRLRTMHTRRSKDGRCGKAPRCDHSAAQPRVIVTSENDRLAMLDTRNASGG